MRKNKWTRTTSNAGFQKQYAAEQEDFRFLTSSDTMKWLTIEQYESRIVEEGEDCFNSWSVSYNE